MQRYGLRHSFHEARNVNLQFDRMKQFRGSHEGHFRFDWIVSSLRIAQTVKLMHLSYLA